MLVRCFLGVIVCIALFSCGDNKNISVDTVSAPEVRTALTGQEIAQAFDGVRDKAEIQDAAGTTAVNHWYSDGRFVNHWRNSTNSGEVTGSWRVVGDERCVLISAGLEGAVGKEKCSPVFKVGERYMSVNADGSVHALHTLTPLLEKPR